MFSYGSFNPNVGAQTPNIAQATAAQGRADNEAQARVDALRSQNMIGAGKVGSELYDRGAFEGAMGASAGGELASSVLTPSGQAIMGGAEATAFDAMMQGQMANAAGATGANVVAAAGTEAAAAEALAASAGGGGGVMGALGAGAGKVGALAAANPVVASIMAAMALRELF